MDDINPAAIEKNREEPFPIKGAISVAVVTGAHPYNVPSFNRLFRSLPGIDAYEQDLDQFVSDWWHVRNLYDVVLFFNWHLDTPMENERLWLQKGMTQALEELGQTAQGIVILHHAVGAFQKWPFWSDMVGIPHAERGFIPEEVPSQISLGETIHVEITDSEHPITSGIKSWDVVGETWDFGASNPGLECHVLMTTDHPKMRMKAMAWTHQFRQSRVFYLQPGHDNDAWSHPTFRTVLLRSIQWAAGRL